MRLYILRSFYVDFYSGQCLYISQFSKFPLQNCLISSIDTSLSLCPAMQDGFIVSDSPAHEGFILTCLSPVNHSHCFCSILNTFYFFSSTISPSTTSLPLSSFLRTFTPSSASPGALALAPVAPPTPPAVLYISAPTFWISAERLS